MPASESAIEQRDGVYLRARALLAVESSSSLIIDKFVSESSLLMDAHVLALWHQPQGLASASV